MRREGILEIHCCREEQWGLQSGPGKDSEGQKASQDGSGSGVAERSVEGRGNVARGSFVVFADRDTISYASFEFGWVSNRTGFLRKETGGLKYDD
jgi:hypothetical protein